jgi:hypothetical protein
MPSDLVDFWRRCDLTQAPFAHPDDLPVLRRQEGRYIDEEPKDFAGFVSSPRFGAFEDTRLHLSLLPIPYSGNLRTADIVVLLLNPGFSFSDYYESRSPEFCDRLKKTLAQNFTGVRFPFVWLDPEYCWHGGFRWWEQKLRAVISRIAKEKFSGKYLEALRDMSNRLALVELIPYHSSSFTAHGLIRDLPSACAARRFAQDAASQGDKTIIVTRQAASWNLSVENDHLVVYEGGLTRGASLGPSSPGGKAILARYGIQSGSSPNPSSSPRGRAVGYANSSAPSAPAMPKASGLRRADYEVRLAAPNAASPGWRGKRGDAFGLIEAYYGSRPSAPLTVAMWQQLVERAGLTKVEYSFLRWYAKGGYITIAAPSTSPAVP